MKHFLFFLCDLLFGRYGSLTLLNTLHKFLRTTKFVSWNILTDRGIYVFNFNLVALPVILFFNTDILSTLWQILHVQQMYFLSRLLNITIYCFVLWRNLVCTLLENCVSWQIFLYVFVWSLIICGQKLGLCIKMAMYASFHNSSLAPLLFDNVII